MTNDTPSSLFRGLRAPLLLGLVTGLLFFLIADHFLSPPDCAFYWAWAESLATRGSFEFTHVYEKLRMPVLYVWLTPAGHLSNDWPMGAGLLLLPVVRLGPAAAHAWMVLWIVAALALWARSAPFSPSARGVALAATVLGTPLLFYAAFGPFFSHPASFAAVTAFLVAWDRTRPGRPWREWLLLGLLLGFAALVRPQNGLLGIVLLAEVPGWFRAGSSSRPRLRDLLLFGLGAFVAFSPQMLAWWTLYGSPFTLPKVDEMNWLRPHLGELLFSDFHGVLPWTPVYGLALLGLLVLGRRDRPLAAGLALALAAQIYLNAANLVWWSGGSFGNRRLGDSAIIVAYAIAALWDARRGETSSSSSAIPVPHSSGLLLHIVTAVGVALSCLWTLTLLLAERRGLLPLDRYVPFNGPGFLDNLLRTWSTPGETASALTRPLKASLGPGATQATAIGARVLSTLFLATGSAAMLVALRHLSRARAPRLALPLGGLALFLALITAVAGLRTPPIRNAASHNIVRQSSGILWDNYIELSYYHIARRRPVQAEAAARRAMALRPNHYSSHWYLATALRDQGRHREAAEAYGEVLRLNPKHPLAARERDAALVRSSQFGLFFP